MTTLWSFVLTDKYDQIIDLEDSQKEANEKFSPPSAPAMLVSQRVPQKKRKLRCQVGRKDKRHT